MNRQIEGKRVPEVTFRTRTAEGEWKDVSTKDLFAGKNVVVFSLPGAFTPTCSTAHVPRYNELVGDFKAAGIDSVLCVSVNDTFVMNAWQQDQKADNITFVPDGNGEFSEGLGLLVDKSQLGFGKRSWRYAMVVRDGVIDKAFIEPEKEGDPYEVSDADTVLASLTGNKPLKNIVLFTKPGCGHCKRAKNLLSGRGLRFREIDADPGVLLAVSGRQSTPQIFINGEHIGGADELEGRIASL
ncbi:MAG: glutathione peroxidase [Polyangiales bacterium]